MLSLFEYVLPAMHLPRHAGLETLAAIPVIANAVLRGKSYFMSQNLSKRPQNTGSQQQKA